MTPNGPCFMCGEPTGRYDDDLKRWACSVCHPEPVAWELKLLDDERRDLERDAEVELVPELVAVRRRVHDEAAERAVARSQARSPMKSRDMTRRPAGH